MNTYQRRTISTTLLSAALFGLVGCKTPDAWKSRFDTVTKLNKHLPWYDEKQPREGIPVRVTGDWVDTVLYQEGKKPQRGFGGRLHFYGEEGEDPILVDGQLVVYAFDETKRAPTDNMPTRRYVFPADQLPPRMSLSELGASYSIWCPWDEVGGPETQVSLMCRFEPKLGPHIVSAQSRHLLPGEMRPESIATGPEKPQVPEGVPFKAAVEQASYHAPANGENNVLPASGLEHRLASTPRAMTSTSIALPQSMRNLGPGGKPDAITNRTQMQLQALPNHRRSATGQNPAVDSNGESQDQSAVAPALDAAPRLNGHSAPQARGLNSMLDNSRDAAPTSRGSAMSSQAMGNPALPAAKVYYPPGESHHVN